MQASTFAQTDDAGLVLAVRNGETAAFEVLLDRHLQGVRMVVAIRAPAAHLVDEITHETFVFAFQHLNEFTPGTSFQAWVRAIAYNLLRSELQRFAREQHQQSRYLEAKLCEIELARPDDVVAREADRLESCLRRLPASWRELVELKYRQDLSTEQIAQRLERGLAWVRTTLFRVRQQLRQCIEGVPS
jgi:RNA polymerase sigma-70 factor (ECF subfamily)